MAENHNGNICVSDCNARIVVAFESEERVWFRYDGKQARKENTFYPRYIVTDASVTCFDNCELHKPCGLSVDNKGRLLVGLYESRIIKVIKYC